MTIKQWVTSMTLKRALWILGGLAIVLGVFKAGEFVGFGRAQYSYRWGENYYRNFAGYDRGPGMMGGGFGGGMMGDENYLFGHGISGTILRVTGPTFVLQDRDGAEKVIAVSSSTSVRMFREEIQPSDLKEGLWVVVIGAPNDAGVIDARLVRVMPMAPFQNASSSVR